MVLGTKSVFFYPISRYMEWTGPARPDPARPDPARPDRNALWRLITQKVWKIETWNFNTIFTQHSNLCYQNLELISLIVWKLWSFPQGSNFVNFQQFFHHNFRLEWKIWILWFWCRGNVRWWWWVAFWPKQRKRKRLSFDGFWWVGRGVGQLELGIYVRWIVIIGGNSFHC